MIINVGHYRTGTTTLTYLFDQNGYRTWGTFPDNLSNKEKALLLLDPSKVIRNLVPSVEDLANRLKEYDFAADGFFPWIIFLPAEDLEKLVALTHAKLVATTRSVDAVVKSELHHWIRHNLEEQFRSGCKELGLSPDAYNLAALLRERFLRHEQKLREFPEIVKLPLEHANSWLLRLSTLIKLSPGTKVEKMNSNPPLPLEAILLTYRLGVDANKKVFTMLDRLEDDPLMR